MQKEVLLLFHHVCILRNPAIAMFGSHNDTWFSTPSSFALHTGARKGHLLFIHAYIHPITQTCKKNTAVLYF